MAAVYGADGDHAPGDRVFKPVERVMYRLTGVDEKREQRWQAYAFSLLAFSFISVIVLYVLQRIQSSLPLNPTDVAERARKRCRTTPRSASSPTRTGRTTRPRTPSAT